MNDRDLEMFRMVANGEMLSGCIGPAERAIFKRIVNHIDQQDQLIKDLEFQRDSFEKAANDWMADFDKLKAKYESTELVESKLKEGL